MQPRVVFVVGALARDWPDIATFDETGFGRQPERFRRGVDNWIVQTYVRTRASLEARGVEVRISERFERDAICVAHRDDLNRYADPLYDCYLIGVRADRPQVIVANVEIVQNALQLGPARSRLMPHWPQPGLLPRDASRGTRVECVAYMGRTNSVRPGYLDPSFPASAAALGLKLEIRNEDWHDYSNVDVLVAHRRENAAMLRNKPASKLVNAWLAGVPAIVAPEPAFEQLRRDPLDFIATNDAASTLEALRLLASSPERYRAMVENGSRRALEFGVDAVRRRWVSFFLEEAIPAFERWRWDRPTLAVRYARHVAAMSAQKLAAKRFRLEERLDREALIG